MDTTAELKRTTGMAKITMEDVRRAMKELSDPVLVAMTAELLSEAQAAAGDVWGSAGLRFPELWRYDCFSYDNPGRIWGFLPSGDEPFGVVWRVFDEDGDVTWVWQVDAGQMTEVRFCRDAMRAVEAVYAAKKAGGQ